MENLNGSGWERVELGESSFRMLSKLYVNGHDLWDESAEIGGN